MKKLILLTDTFPYGTVEKTFILPELPELAKSYDVTIVSHASEDILKDEAHITILPSEIKVVNLEIKLTLYRKIKYFFKFFLEKDGIRETGDILRSKKDILQRIYQSISFYALAMENYRMMRRANLLLKDEMVIYYTYWYFYSTYSLSKNKKLFPNMKLVTRTHRFDLYDKAYSGNRQPFKRIMDENIDRIVFIAEQGKNYYLNNYNIVDSNKYVVNRLGTREPDCLADIDMQKHDKFRLVSCSSVIPLKRVGLIVEALSELTDEVEWIHFGTGSEFDSLKEQADKLLQKKDNITYHLKGYVANPEIMEYYSKNYVDCFISTSSSEGIPVSIQEAISFGIPVIATKVGGVPELFEHNGILLEGNPDKKDVVDAIEKMINMDKQEYEILRINSYKMWSERYNTEKNVKEFMKLLEELFPV